MAEIKMACSLFHFVLKFINNNLWTLTMKSYSEQSMYLCIYVCSLYIDLFPLLRRPTHKSMHENNQKKKKLKDMDGIQKCMRCITDK